MHFGGNSGAAKLREQGRSSIISVFVVLLVVGNCRV